MFQSDGSQRTKEVCGQSVRPEGHGWPVDSAIRVSWTRVTLKPDQHGGKRARGHVKEPEGHVGAMTGGTWRSCL